MEGFKFGYLLVTLVHITTAELHLPRVKKNVYELGPFELNVK